MRIFNGDYSLPALPVPKLEDSCRYLKEMIRPLVEAEVFDAASTALDAFAADKGPLLQKMLLTHADSDAFNSSWLRPIWDDMYLSFREMLPVNMNYNFQFVKGWLGENELPTLMSALAKAIGKLRTGSLPPETNREGFLSMDSAANMIFTRIPGRIRDTQYYPPVKTPMTASVVCKGRWFILALTDKNGNYLGADSVAKALADIRGQAETEIKPSPVGVMTCSDRESAARLREMLLVLPRNRMNLERIEKSVFTVCLDEALEEGEEFGLRLITGEPENRWFDKSIQIICDGTNLGASIEHSGCDAGLWAYLLDQASTLREEHEPRPGGDAHVLPLIWDIPEAASDKLETEAKRYREVRKKLSFCDRRVKEISKEKIKALKCSPDAFVQLLFQAAYFKLTGRFASVYESVSTRGFYEGRTECVRLVTAESADLIRALSVEKDRELMADKFHLVIGIIGEIMKRARQGLGPERHMTGLSMMADIHGVTVPDIFGTEGYKTLRHNTLSTSNTCARFIDFFSFGPVVDDGIGIGYGIKDDALHVAVCAYGESAIDPKRFIDEMEWAANVFYKILIPDV